MSATSASFRDNFGEQKLSVSFRLILGLYSIIPFCILLYLFDGWFFNHYLRDNLPSSPYHFVLFQILFGTPHIIASNILLLSNSDYFNHYKRNIILMTFAIAIAYCLGNMIFPYRTLYILVATWTVLHVLKQQYGIARGLCQLPAWVFWLLLVLSIATGVIIYIGIFLRKSLAPGDVSLIKQMAGYGCFLLFAAGVYCRRNVTTRFGQCFYWSNIVLVLTSFYLFYESYYFMAILVPRFVHDATAYVFYVTHDYNRHFRQPRNSIYRLAARCNIHVFLVLPAMSFLLAFILQAYGDAWVEEASRYLLGKEFHKAITLGVLGYLALMHYYMEGLTWQKDSPYRKYIAFSK